MISGQPIASATSSGPSSAPGRLQPRRRRSAGRHLHEDVDRLLQPPRRASAARRAGPSTFATSCGSTNIVVVPCGITARANSVTVSIPLLDVHVPVAEPGDQVAPARVDHPRLRPDHRPRRPARRTAKRPALIAMSAPSITSRECTFTQAQLRITRSAGARRAATATSSAATSGQAGNGRARSWRQLRPPPGGLQAIFPRQSLSRARRRSPRAVRSPAGDSCAALPESK